MNQRKSFRRFGIVFAMALLCFGSAKMAYGAEEESLLSVTEESQIKPLTDGSGKYLLKSDGFYCLNADGTKEKAQAVHYFDHMEIDGTVLNGYYYHGPDGRFAAGNARLEHLVNVTCGETVFDGYYMVQNLGKLSAVPRVRYFENFTLDDMLLNGYYYFDDNGKMVREPGIRMLKMSCNGRMFDGGYYFGGANGVLLEEEGRTPEGFPIEADGKVTGMEELGMDTLEPQLEALISGYDGEWSIFVKNLGTEEEILLNDKSIYSASLIKIFTLAAAYQNMENVRENEGKLLGVSPEDDKVSVKIHDLLWNMIAVSDNESYNETVRLQTESHDFLAGATQINTYLEGEGYADTSVQSVLQPSSSESVSLGGKNVTSVKDCGTILERIYRGQCVSTEASLEMLGILLEQECTWKIPEGIPDEIRIANKTGETDTQQHDIAIVYGPKTTYILCVMSEGCQEDTAIDNIREISRMVYYYLNL